MVDKLVNSEANRKRIAAVESAFSNSGQPLLIPGRVLVGEGVLTKMCRKKPKPRQFFLFNDVLVYGNIVINKKMYNKQHIIPLEQVRLRSMEDDGELRNGWVIESASKSFAVYAATATEKSEWMAHINKCVNDLIQKGGKHPSDQVAAVWVPDHDASTCMHCKKTHFSVINRRHHCRNCGVVVCGPCSNKKFLLPHMSYKPVRVCLTCFDELTKGKQPALHGPSGGAQKTSPVAEAPNSQDTSGEDSDSDDDATENVAPPVNNEARFFGDETPASAENTQPKAAENDDPVAAAVAAAVAECNQTGAAVAEGNKTEAVVAEGNTTEASVAPGDVMEVAGGDAKTEANCAEPPA